MSVVLNKHERNDLKENSIHEYCDSLLYDIYLYEQSLNVYQKDFDQIEKKYQNSKSIYDKQRYLNGMTNLIDSIIKVAKRIDQLQKVYKGITGIDLTRKE